MFEKFIKHDDVPQSINTVDWLPIENIIGGLVKLKNGQYIKILEVTPINFHLKSETEKTAVIESYSRFLRSCNFPMQITELCRKSNVEPHIKYMQKCISKEENNSLKSIAKSDIQLMEDMGATKAITKRFFIVYPYVEVGTKTQDFNHIKKHMNDKKALIIQHLSKCGNRITDLTLKQDEEFIYRTLTNYLRRSIPIEKLSTSISDFGSIATYTREGNHA